MEQEMLDDFYYKGEVNIPNFLWQLTQLSELVVQFYDIHSN